MDTSDYPSLPRLNRLNAQLSANSRRVEEVIDSQLDRIEQLFLAAISEDWTKVEEVARYLAALEPDVLGEHVVREARQVLDELTANESRAQEPKHLGDLLMACRSVRKNWIS